MLTEWKTRREVALEGDMELAAAEVWRAKMTIDALYREETIQRLKASYVAVGRKLHGAILCLDVAWYIENIGEDYESDPVYSTDNPCPF